MSLVYAQEQLNLYINLGIMTEMHNRKRGLDGSFFTTFFHNSFTTFLAITT